MRAIMKAGTWAALFLLAAVALIAAVPTQTRAIPVNSTTAVSLTSGSTIAAETCGAAVDTDTLTLGATGSTTADIYNGLVVTVAGCAATKIGDYLITDYAVTSKQADFTPAATAAPDPNCTCAVGPSLPSNVREISIGGAAGTIYLSRRSGGTAGTDRIALVGGQWITLQAPRGFTYVEILSVSATDTAYVSWN